MKKAFFVVAIIITGGMACSKQNQTTEIPANDPIDTSKAVIKYSGQFSSAPGESVSGKALILFQNGAYSIALENLDVSNGPDLHLYLSTDLHAEYFIDLGKLKSTRGNQVYTLTSGPDITQYKYALIFCQQYNVLFGSAELR
jgi:Electron transfer DM13